MSAPATQTIPKITHRRGYAQYFIERLNESVSLDMVLIPNGHFVMGSHTDELERRNNESPQHEVNVPTFFLGKYAVTQAQYEAVMGNNPSYFKNEPDSPNHPVEQVSWDDATEFCRRLSDQTGKEYRLPSEAEWEYACRAMTSPPVPLPISKVGIDGKIYPPFHFGETISTELANYRGTDEEKYNWSGSYGRGAKGIYRERTTPVGSFEVANAFGLYDMHGNVWEWCEDTWHSNYEGAPTDGSAWVDELNKTSHSLRGGSWINDPQNCRSACRYNFNTVNRFINIGFRVACSARGLL
jgi:formylglycine-generating enzyme required for sulfatase activity